MPSRNVSTPCWMAHPLFAQNNALIRCMLCPPVGRTDSLQKRFLPRQSVKEMLLARGDGKSRQGGRKEGRREGGTAVIHRRVASTQHRVSTFANSCTCTIHLSKHGVQTFILKHRRHVRKRGRNCNPRFPPPRDEPKFPNLCGRLAACLCPIASSLLPPCSLSLNPNPNSLSLCCKAKYAAGGF